MIYQQITSVIKFIMSLQLTEQQYSIIKQLKLLDPQPSFRGFPDISPLHQSYSQEQSIQTKEKELFFDVDYDQEHKELRQKLFSYRKKSQQIYQVGQLLKEYESKFKSLMQDKDKLIELIKGMKGDTSEIVEKQKKLIDLSMKMKESLDYYSYHTKFSFDYPCEIGCRQMFQNILQQTLSEITDSIQYFQENSTYSQSKKYLSMFQSSRSKVLSFVKSFFIKLFNKESQFMNKNQKLSFNGFFQTFYPKSKFKFISTFLMVFPQFAPKLQHILKAIKETSNEEQLKFLELKEIQIFQFQLNKNNHSLIGYLQNHMPEIYQESILHFITYYRINFHQNFAKNDKKQLTSPKVFYQKFIEIIYILSSEYAYMCYCCRIVSYDKAEMIRSSISSLSKLYFEDFYKSSKQIRNKNTFQICEAITKIKDNIGSFLNNHVTQEYQSYALGSVSSSIKDKQHIQYLKSLFDLYIKKFLSQMEILCFNKLPNFQLKASKNEVEDQVRQFLTCIPKLKYCQGYAEKYLIATLDCLVKSIKEANSKIQSRFECYIWNIELFCTIRQSIKGIKGNLIRKQLKFDTNNSSNMIQKVKNLQRSESLVKYAQDLFKVLKTGMPVINQLTLDFNKYVNQHCQVLESQFVKDILYIYAKNMIEFLQRFNEAQEQSQEKLKAAFQSNSIQALYNSYTLSIQKFTKDAQTLMKEHEAYRFMEENTLTIKNLLNLVYDKLFDFMDNFYVNISAYASETQDFKEIQAMKLLYKKSW